MIELVVGALLVVGTLSWNRHESAAAKRAAPVTSDDEEPAPTRRRVAMGLLMVLGVTLVVSGITGT